jgi:hypothetical protein
MPDRCVAGGTLMKSTFNALTLCVAIAVASLVTVLAQTPAQAPKPGPEHKRLAYFVGSWTSTGEAKPGPFGPGGKMTGTDTCEWFEGGFAVICRGQGTGPMGPMKNVGILSYSPEEKVYTYYGVDNSGMAMTSIPKGTVKGNTWTFHDEGVMGGQKFKSRVTVTEVSPTEQTFLMEVQGADGKWMPMMESKGTKKK